MRKQREIGQYVIKGNKIKFEWLEQFKVEKEWL